MIGGHRYVTLRLLFQANDGIVLECSPPDRVCEAGAAAGIVRRIEDTRLEEQLWSRTCTSIHTCMHTYIHTQ